MLTTAALILIASFAHPAQAHHRPPPGPVVVISPAVQRAEVLVENRTGRVVELFVDGVRAQDLGPGSTRMRMLLGRHLLEARVGGRVIGRWAGEARPYEQVVWAIDPPAVSELLVTNPLPIPAVIEVAGIARTVPANGSLFIEALPVGRMHMTIRRTTGQVFDTVDLAIGPWEAARYVLTPPERGLVVVQNAERRPLALYADGRFVGQVMPMQETTLEVPLGALRLDLVDETGRYSQLLESVQLRVDPFEVERVVVQAAPVSCTMPHDHRAHETPGRDERPVALAIPQR